MEVNVTGHEIDMLAGLFSDQNQSESQQLVDIEQRISRNGQDVAPNVSFITSTNTFFYVEHFSFILFIQEYYRVALFSEKLSGASP